MQASYGATLIGQVSHFSPRMRHQGDIKHSVIVLSDTGSYFSHEELA